MKTIHYLLIAIILGQLTYNIMPQEYHDRAEEIAYNAGVGTRVFLQKLLK